MNGRAIEIKVGIFVMSAAAILIGLVVALGDISFNRTWSVNVEYGFSGSIHAGAPVRLSGVQLGRVASIDLIQDGRRDDTGRPLMVKLRLELEERARGILREDSAFYIGTAGMLGEAYVDVDTGPMQGAPLQDGDSVRGVDPPRTDLLLSKASRLVESLSEVMDDDDGTFADLLGSLTRVTRAADDLLAENGDSLVQLVDNLNVASDEISKAARAAGAQLDGDLGAAIADARITMAGLREELPELVADARGITSQLAAVSDVISAVDAQDLANLRETLGRYEAAGVRLEQLARDAHLLVESLERGEGTLGALLKDDQVYEDLNALLADIRKNPWKLLRRR